MPNAKKLPSGSWRVRATKNKITRSFTAKDKLECQMMAIKWLQEAVESDSGTVKGYIRDYIASREKSLSPSTVAAYKSYLAHAYSDIEDKRSLTDADVQRWIDKYALTHSPKTCANAFGLLTVATGRSYKVRMPQRKRPAFRTPNDDDVKRLLYETQGTDMEKAVILAAFGTLREGEVCALTKSDIKGDTVSVSKAYAWNGDGYTLKKPKTAESVRRVQLPKKYVKVLLSGEDEKIVALTPKQLSHAFGRLVKRLGMDFRFHDLRAYAASVRHALGIPDQYIMADGGWKTDNILKTVYRRAMDDKRKEFAKIATEHFDNM